MTKLGIRYYDPTLGRFTQVDPTGQDAHYTYAGNNPVNFVDPSGASCLNIAVSFFNSSVCDQLDFDVDFGLGVGAGIFITEEPTTDGTVSCQAALLGGAEVSYNAYTGGDSGRVVGLGATCGIQLASLDSYFNTPAY